MFTKEQLGGVLGRKSAKVKKAADHTKTSMARANAVLDLAVLFQGEDLKHNAVWIIKASIERDPDVRGAIEKAGIALWQEVRVDDKRYTCGYRMERDAALISRRNGFVYQSKSGSTQAAFKELRTLGGSRIIDSPQTLQRWAMQSEIPRIRFVDSSYSSAVCVDIGDLLNNHVLKNEQITQYIRKSFPYDKDVIFVWYMVSIHPPSCALTYLIVLVQSEGLCLWW